MAGRPSWRSIFAGKCTRLHGVGSCIASCARKCTQVIMMLYHKDGEASLLTAWKTPAAPSPLNPRPYSQSFRDKVVLLRVRACSKTCSTAGLAAGATDLVHERWLAALETAKFNTLPVRARRDKVQPHASHACSRGVCPPPALPYYSVLCPP